MTSEKSASCRHQWLMSLILATQEAEIRRIVVGGYLRERKGKRS
jgi:hypothetical protein